MLEIFHGSTMPVSSPLVNYGREQLDFGTAFYTTDLREQAEKWATYILRRQEGTPTISRYTLNIEALLADGYKTIKFPEYNLEWLNFVCDNRRGGSSWKQYDIIEGGIANDKVIDTVELYMDGIIDSAQALGRLKYETLNNQIAIVSQEIVNNYLTFTGSYTL